MLVYRLTEHWQKLRVVGLGVGLGLGLALEIGEAGRQTFLYVRTLRAACVIS